MAADAEPIDFIAVVYKVQSLVDGGIRITLDLPETATLQAAQLMVCQAQGVTLAITCKAIESNAVPKRQKRQSQWQATQESGMDQDSGDGWQ